MTCVFRKSLFAALCAVMLVSGCKTLEGGGFNQLLSTAAGSAGAGAGVTAGMQSAVAGATDLFREYTPEEQQRLGADFASVLLGARPLVRNPAAQRYVNQVGVWVVQQTAQPTDGRGRPMIKTWRFGIIDSEAVNAYATPGGYVFITRGLFKKLGSEAELAGVLSHEIAHVTQGHYLAAIKAGGFSRIVAGAVQAGSGDKRLDEAAANLVRNLYAKGLDKSDEYEADRLGMLYAARAGYEPTGLMSVLHLYAAHARGDDGFQLLFATHPDPKDRIARLEPLLVTFATASDATNAQRFKAIQARL